MSDRQPQICSMSQHREQQTSQTTVSNDSPATDNETIPSTADDIVEGPVADKDTTSIDKVALISDIRKWVEAFRKASSRWHKS